jgi:hypothetical protein
MSLEKQPPSTFRFESIAHWLSAFHIFVSIYTEKFPNEAGALMKYAHMSIFWSSLRELRLWERAAYNVYLLTMSQILPSNPKL